MKAIRSIVLVLGFIAIVFGCLQVTSSVAYASFPDYCYDFVHGCPYGLCGVDETVCWNICNEQLVFRTCAQPLCDDAC